MASFKDRFKIRGWGDRQKQLSDTVQFVAGVDPGDPSKPRFLPITEAGLKIDTVATGFTLPAYDEISITMYGATNNIHLVQYSLHSIPVALLTLTYVGGGAADNDVLLGVVKSIPSNL